MAKLTRAQLSATVDTLGKLKAKLAVLGAQESALKQALVDGGERAYQGTLFDATVTEAQRTTLDVEAVRKELGADWVARHSTVSGYVSVRVVARKQNRRAA